MLEPAFRSLLCRIGHRLRVDGGAHDFPDYLQPKLKEVHDVLMHASTCKLDLDHIVGEERVIQCKYPSCNNGKILWRHIYLCSGVNCLLCDAMLRMVLFHAGQCTDSNCVIPRCSDFKEKIRRKERKSRKIEKNLVKEKIHHKEKKVSEIEKRLKKRKTERGLKRMYNMQLLESELALLQPVNCHWERVKVFGQKPESPVVKVIADRHRRELLYIDEKHV